MASGFDGDAAVEEGGDLVGELLGAFGVGDCDFGSASLQELRGGHTGLA